MDIFNLMGIELLTVKLRNDPIKLPSSYRDIFESDASSTDISFDMRP